MILGLPVVWVAAFFVLPITFVILYSFWPTVNYQIVHEFTLHNYARIRGNVYLKVIFSTLKTSLIVTFVAVLLGYPVAYHLARKVKNFRSMLVILVILPLWTSYLVRTFAWMLILGRDGIVNHFLQGIGLLDKPITWLLYSNFAVTLALINIYVPFLILPTYSVLERMDWNLLEAARDLGASRWRAFREITLPLSLPGITTGGLFVFISSMGAYVTPELLGGPSSQMIGDIIAQQFGATYEYGFGSALALVLMLTILVVAAIGLYFGRPKGV